MNNFHPMDESEKFFECYYAARVWPGHGSALYSIDKHGNLYQVAKFPMATGARTAFYEQKGFIGLNFLIDYAALAAMSIGVRVSMECLDTSLDVLAAVSLGGRGTFGEL